MFDYLGGLVRGLLINTDKVPLVRIGSISHTTKSKLVPAEIAQRVRDGEQVLAIPTDKLLDDSRFIELFAVFPDRYVKCYIHCNDIIPLGDYRVDHIPDMLVSRKKEPPKDLDKQVEAAWKSATDLFDFKGPAVPFRPRRKDPILSFSKSLLYQQSFIDFTGELRWRGISSTTFGDWDTVIKEHPVNIYIPQDWLDAMGFTTSLVTQWVEIINSLGLAQITQVQTGVEVPGAPIMKLDKNLVTRLIRDGSRSILEREFILRNNFVCFKVTPDESRAVNRMTDLLIRSLVLDEGICPAVVMSPIEELQGLSTWQKILLILGYRYRIDPQRAIVFDHSAHTIDGFKRKALVHESLQRCFRYYSRPISPIVTQSLENRLLSGRFKEFFELLKDAAKTLDVDNGIRIVNIKREKQHPGLPKVRPQKVKVYTNLEKDIWESAFIQYTQGVGIIQAGIDQIDPIDPMSYPDAAQPDKPI